MRIWNNIFCALIAIGVLGLTVCKIAGKGGGAAGDALELALCAGLAGNALTKTGSDGRRRTDWLTLVLVAACIAAIVYGKIHQP